ncbi:MAG: LysM peptidoglycan-binding domain-containing protein [Desulfuromonadales bacterium]|nr:LysM peptidoglycan-binding domain-containing protein [Desulfuromonadales bacterium]
MNKAKKMLLLMAILAVQIFFTTSLMAENEPYVTYVIKKGDTLWGLSERFIKDPYYWPTLWANNAKDIGNPHFIYPGQKLKIFRNRIEVVNENPVQPPVQPVPTEQSSPSNGATLKSGNSNVTTTEKDKDIVFTVTGGEGFIAEKKFVPSGYIIASQNNKPLLGVDDVVYTDLGRKDNAHVGDVYAIYKKYGAVTHPLTNVVLGYKVVQLGTLQLTEIEENSSKALITHSFMEIEPGSYLLPYKSGNREISLKAADRDLSGSIVATKRGNETIVAGDIAYIDLGKNQGIQEGNMLYVVRAPEIDRQFIEEQDIKLPMDVLGAVVVVSVGENTSTVLTIKSVDTIYPGDKVELKKGI